MFSVVKSFGEGRKMQKVSIQDKVNLMQKNSFQEYSVVVELETLSFARRTEKNANGLSNKEGSRSIEEFRKT